MKSIHLPYFTNPYMFYSTGPSFPELEKFGYYSNLGSVYTSDKISPILQLLRFAFESWLKYP